MIREVRQQPSVPRGLKRELTTRDQDKREMIVLDDVEGFVNE